MEALPACAVAAQFAACISLAFTAVSPVHAATGTHLPQSTLYPRLIRLHHAPGSLKNSILAKTGNKLFRSLDEGRTFTFLATVPTASLEPGNPIPDKSAKDKERCCSTIYELPRKLGHFRAGTLLYSGSFFSDSVPSVEIYTSTDQGAHWRYLSTPMKSGDDHHGLWEPEFTITKAGDLAMFVSDETDPCCSQKLVKMRTHDLVNWSSKQDTVAGRSPNDRPGMAVVSRLPDGTYFMSYEVCGPATQCQVYSRTSRDGWNFGDPASFGTKAVTTTGQYLAHAPTSFYDAASRRILLVGQVLHEADGTVSPQNGRLIFTSGSPRRLGVVECDSGTGRGSHGIRQLLSQLLFRPHAGRRRPARARLRLRRLSPLHLVLRDPAITMSLASGHVREAPAVACSSCTPRELRG